MRPFGDLVQVRRRQLRLQYRDGLLGPAGQVELVGDARHHLVAGRRLVLVMAHAPRPELPHAQPVVRRLRRRKAFRSRACSADPPPALLGPVPGSLPVSGDLGRFDLPVLGQDRRQGTVQLDPLAAEEPSANGLGKERVSQVHAVVSDSEELSVLQISQGGGEHRRVDLEGAGQHVVGEWTVGDTQQCRHAPRAAAQQCHPSVQ